MFMNILQIKKISELINDSKEQIKVNFHNDILTLIFFDLILVFKFLIFNSPKGNREAASAASAAFCSNRSEKSFIFPAPPDATSGILRN